ncbi:MAG: CvpA family protein [Alphaproteobacteria bacterium]
MDVGAFDIAVVVVVVLGGLLGLSTGFLRGGLFILSWVGAALVTLHAFPYARPLARQHVQPDLIADIGAGAVVFIAALVMLHIVAGLLSGWVRGSRLNALDRSLGLLGGLACGAALVAVVYLPLSDMVGDDQPEWLATARTRPLVERAALIVRQALPEEMVRETGKLLEQRRREAETLDRVRQDYDRLTRPPATATPQAGTPQGGYGANERNALDRKIEDVQR